MVGANTAAGLEEGAGLRELRTMGGAKAVAGVGRGWRRGRG